MGTMAYKGINFCDRCGEVLERGGWLSGLCKVCEAAAKAVKKPVRVVKPTRGVL